MLLIWFNYLVDFWNSCLTNENVVIVADQLSTSYTNAKQALGSFLQIIRLFIDQETITVMILNYSLIAGALLTVGIIKFILSSIDEMPLVP